MDITTAAAKALKFDGVGQVGVTLETLPKGAEREAVENRIRSIQANGIAAAELARVQTPKIAKLRKQGKNALADREQANLDNTVRAAGTPEFQQQTIKSLTRQRDARPSIATSVYNQLAPGTSKALTDAQSLSEQYLPRGFNDKLQAEARSIIERFKAVQETIQGELEKLDLNIQEIEAEIQTKLKSAGYAPQKIDLTDPKRIELLRKVAPKETATLEQATARRLQVDLAGQTLDQNAETAAARSVSIGKRREQLNADRANTDYLATTQDGNLFAQIQVDKQREAQGKTDLDLQFKQDAISAELYEAKLKQVRLETNTLRNAIQPLRAATTGFFDDIFKGQGIFDGLGNAMKNLAVNILKNFQDMISKQLGQQLFASLAAGVGDFDTLAE